MRRTYIIGAVLVILIGATAFFAGMKYREYQAVTKDDRIVSMPEKIVRLPLRQKIDEIRWCPFWGKYCYVIKR